MAQEGYASFVLKPQLCTTPHAALVDVPQLSNPRDWIDLGKGVLVLPPDLERHFRSQTFLKKVNLGGSHHRGAIREASFALNRLGSRYPVSGRTVDLVVWRVDRSVGLPPHFLVDLLSIFLVVYLIHHGPSGCDRSAYGNEICNRLYA